MTTPRSELIDPENALHYHLVSRCVRRSYLCGKDKQTGKNYNHRKKWLEDRLFHLAQHFAVAIDAYVVMDNHFHLVVYYDPLESCRWSDEEVADRWLAIFPPRLSANEPFLCDIEKQRLLANPEQLHHARTTLGSLSMFMKHLKQPIAFKANREDECKGHFFEGRFYSGALLDEEAVIAAMAYVDLNPVRARIAEDIETYRASSGYQRTMVTKNTQERLVKAVMPLVSGLTYERPALSYTLPRYLGLLNDIVSEHRVNTQSDKRSTWYQKIASLKKRQRAYGTHSDLVAWQAKRNWSACGSAMPTS